MIIAIVGMPGSGKSSVARHLESKGFPLVRFGQIIIDEVKNRGLGLSPQNEAIVREALRAEFGMDVCARRSVPTIRSAHQSNSIVVIDGLYSWSEYKVLRAEFGKYLVLIAVVAARCIRYQRLSLRAIRPLNMAEAESRDVAEIERLEKGGPLAIADHFLLNERSERELLESVDELYARLLLLPAQP